MLVSSAPASLMPIPAPSTEPTARNSLIHALPGLLSQSNGISSDDILAMSEFQDIHPTDRYPCTDAVKTVLDRARTVYLTMGGDNWDTALAADTRREFIDFVAKTIDDTLKRFKPQQ